MFRSLPLSRHGVCPLENTVADQQRQLPGHNIGHCSTHLGSVLHVQRVLVPHSSHRLGGRGCWHQRCSNLCSWISVIFETLSWILGLTIHHNTHLHLEGGLGVDLDDLRGVVPHKLHYCRDSLGCSRPDNRSRYYRPGGGRSRRRNDLPEDVPTCLNCTRLIRWDCRADMSV
jgi:hypothetical protein